LLAAGVGLAALALASEWFWMKRKS
jgi:hypothetical protein